ncbi:MAG: SIS domain-containing protein [Sulfuritalea sp.]|nr:SIS domain-containing protein [Sulfuritalea sp.]
MSAKPELSVAIRATGFGDLLTRCVATDDNNSTQDLELAVDTVCAEMTAARARGSRLYLVGNGGSAGVASHSATDFFNAAKLRALTLHESSLMTCMANDFGYENAFARMLLQLVEPGDVVVAISSSGRSMNIRNAARQAAENGGQVITLSGFAGDNPLRRMGSINFWLDSSDYGMVEIGHQFLLHNLSDRIRTASTR